MTEAEQRLFNQLMVDERLTDYRWVAYIMATTKHETNKTFKPVEEAYWLSDGWRATNLRYYPWHGRGFVQITWKVNYQKMSHRLNIPVLATVPDIALDWEPAYEILVVGMLEGLFTGRDLDDFINEQYCDYYRARKIVNGMDKAALIADYAADYEDWTEVKAEAKPPEPEGPFKDSCQLITLKQSKVPVRDACVVVLQKALKKWRVSHNAGYMPPSDPLLVDGVFGEKTENRVLEFQIASILKPDGIVGPKTWAALEPHL